MQHTMAATVGFANLERVLAVQTRLKAPRISHLQLCLLQTPAIASPSHPRWGSGGTETLPLPVQHLRTDVGLSLLVMVTPYAGRFAFAAEGGAISAIEAPRCPGDVTSDLEKRPDAAQGGNGGFQHPLDQSLQKVTEPKLVTKLIIILARLRNKLSSPQAYMLAHGIDEARRAASSSLRQHRPSISSLQKLLAIT
ncbi:hypothetical protein NLG97_g591 [Lecanicillium saksenae]|uniref:Uncharacterized protein n=1 Tax=Lecanicillium saksenae TaxID=468837 RepID=A0ACC1R6C8_9HYPO|nr:hypothetical protein NLG97_g591 [Lecanicillium saksenae]